MAREREIEEAFQAKLKRRQDDDELERFRKQEREVQESSMRRNGSGGLRGQFVNNFSPSQVQDNRSYSTPSPPRTTGQPYERSPVVHSGQRNDRGHQQQYYDPRDRY